MQNEEQNNGLFWHELDLIRARITGNYHKYPFPVIKRGIVPMCTDSK